MATEGINAPPEGQPAEDLGAALQRAERDLAAANARAQVMEETLTALRQPPPQQPQQLPPGKRYVIPPHIRQQIAAAGLADTEIDQNGDLIVPFLQAYLGQAASEVLALIQQQADEIQSLHMLRDGTKYPHADALFAEMKRIRTEEQKAGRYMNPDTAYRIAVANNYEKLAQGGGDTEGQFAPRSAPASPAALRSRDVSVGGSLRSVRGPTTAPEAPVRSGDDLMGMTREERRAFFEQNGNTPIR